MNSQPSHNNMPRIFNRFEFKYKISPITAIIIQRQLKRCGMKPDPFASKHLDNTYRVTSLYFDSAALKDYYDKEGGFLARKKIRARIYEPYLKDSNIVWLEIKQKNDVSINKKRVELTLDEWKLIEKGEYNKLLNQKAERNKQDREILEHILFHMIGDGMTPRTITTYDRQPLIYNHVEGLRVTFDKNFDTCSRNDLCYTQRRVEVLPKHEVIMELKFGTLLPLWLKDIVTKFELKRIAYSKYTHATEALRAHLPIPR